MRNVDRLLRSRPDLGLLRRQYRWCRKTEVYSQHKGRTAIKFLWWALYQALQLDFSFRTDDGLLFVSMPGNWSSLATYIQNYRDPGIQKFIRRIVAPQSTFVDVGANIGTYTVFAAATVGPKGKVVAIEPHPLIFEYLQRNVRGNHLQNVLAVEVAVGALRKTAAMKYSKQNPGETHVASQYDAQATEVPMARLDDVLADLGIGKVDYLKIDVEGYELYVLQGATHTIAASPNVIIQTESVPAHAERYGRCVADVAEFLFSSGFVPHAVDGSGIPQAVNKDRLGRIRDLLWSREELTAGSP
jgi:FkbM family methyltransferase